MLFGFTNLFLISSIAADRLMIVTLSHRFPPTRRRSIILITVSWIGGFLVAISGATGFLTEFVYQSSTKHCSPSWDEDVFRIGSIVFNFGITVPSLVLCYAIITFYIWREGLRLKSHGPAIQTPSAMSNATTLAYTMRKIKDKKVLLNNNSC